MNWNFFVVCTLVFTGLLLVPSVQGVNLLTIDTFVTGGSASSIIYTITAYGTPTTWYSPYNLATPPQAKFFNTADALGGQRDLILGYVDPVPIGSTAIVNVVSRKASISFPLNWIGGAYFQWDGFDDAGSGTAFPGATLNPGLTAPVDITFNGQATGLALSITSDQDTDYRVTLVNSAGTRNQYRFILRANEPAFTFVPLLYTSSIWNSPGFNFADVRGFEVQIQTGTDTSSNAPDTQFTPLFIFSYAVSGQAFVRCNCGTTSIDQDVVGAQIDLYTAANVFIRSTTTDINGDYTFWNLNPVTYNICYHDTTAQLCTASTARCQSVTIDPLVPAASYTVNFAVTQSTTFTIPADVTGDCSDCEIPDGTANCPGYAQTTGCLGGVTVVTAFTDVTTGDSCRTNIARTWTSPDDGSKKTQHLTFLDTTPPVFTTPPQDLTQDCDNIITTLADWVNADGFADESDDCSQFFVNNNWNGLPVGPCNHVTVTFTLQDQCGNVRLPASTATYTLQDNFGPSIDSPALDLTVECAAKTTNVITSLNSWLSRHADAVASDNCASASSISWTNNYAQLTPLNPNSCLDSVDVTFTAHDTCGNTNSDVATFTVQDTTSAVFTTNPQNFNQQCAGTTADNNAFNNWLNNNANARFTDACSTNDRDITISNDFNGATINECSDAIVVNFTLQDFCGNPSVTQAATFTIVDSLPPVFSSFASDLTVECDGVGNQSDFDAWIADNGGARATDACTAVTFSVDQLVAPATPTCRSSLLTTFTASDQCGLSASTQATFTIVDTTAPFFVNLPADSGAECNTGTAQAYLDWLNAEAGATASDLCNPATVIIQDNDPALVLGCNRANVVQFRAVDECLNASPIQTAAFTVVDTTSPVITNTGAPLDIECNSATSASDYNTWLLAHAGGDAVDDCTSVFWTNDGGNPITLGCLFTRDVTFTANDQCGFSDFFVQTATITDNTPPVLQNQAVDQDIQCNIISTPTSNDLYANWITAHGFATATDSCTAITWSDDHVGLVGIDTCFASETVTFTASDACAGHSVQTTATFTVRDTQPPNVIQGAQVTTVECDPSLNGNAFLAWIQNHGNAIVQDACSPLTWSVSLFQTPVGCSSVTVQFTADDGCGSSIVTTGTFNIVDTLPPTFVTTAQNVRFECDGAGNVADYANYLATHGGAVATDVCTTSATWTNNAIGTGPVGCGAETIAFTVTDSCGEHSTTTGTFTIIDSFAPSIFPPAADQSAECDNNSNPIAIATWLIAHGGASATDSCYSTGSLTWTNNFTTLTPLPCGAAATVTFSVSDPCLNTARTTATFRVNDTTPPVITKQAQDLVLECNAATNNQDTLTWVNSRAGASATDSCTTVTWTNNFVATPDPCSGPYVINYYATDQCGNRATSTASVTIIDTVAPTFVDFPEDVQVVCDEITDSSVTGIPGFNDNCLSADVIRSETDAISVQPSERLCPGDTIITRTWKLTDACGNVATKDQLIIVSIPQGPCIPQPCIPCEEQPLLCCASSIAPVPCNPVECTPVDCAHTQCTTVPCLPVVCGNGAPPPFQDDDDTIAPSPRPQASECEPIYIYVFDDDDGVSTQPVYTVSFVSGASSVSFSLFSLILAFLLIFM